MTFISTEYKQYLILLIPLSVILLWNSCAFSGEQKPDSGNNIPISFSADKIISNLQEKTVILTGKAFISQTDRQINADQITIVFSDTKKNSGNEKTPSRQIDKLTARGNVTIIMGTRKAVTQTAVFTASDKKLTLTGEDSRISGPEGELICNMITVDQSRSVSECTGGGKSRASGLIFSDKNGF